MRFVEASLGTSVIHDGVTKQGQDLPSTRNAGKTPGSRCLFLEHDHGVLVFMFTLRAINNIFFWTPSVGTSCSALGCSRECSDQFSWLNSCL